MGIFNTLASLFTTTSTTKMIDELVFTDEEKTKAKIDLLKHYEPFKMAQRILGVIFTITFCTTFMVGLVVLIAGGDIKPIVEYVQTFGLDNIMLSIIVFYFAGGTLNTIIKK